jgi:glycolate oxidase
MTKLLDLLSEVVGTQYVLTGGEINPDYTHDECLDLDPQVPIAVVLPADTTEVSDILRIAAELQVPVVARGSATGLSGASRPNPNGIVVSFERMQKILEIDTDNHVAVVQPGVSLEQLDFALAGHGLVYPVSPGQLSASLGGNVGTNAGGMRAVRYGVTRNHVLGLEIVLAGGQVLRTGGKLAKTSTGYDLTQLIVGSEGTLALVTEIIVRLQPRPSDAATVLIPFPSLEHITAAVPATVGSGLNPTILEYIDVVSMAAITTSSGLELGISPEVKEKALAYLIVVIEQNSPERLQQDIEHLADLVEDRGALDVYVLPPKAAEELITARENTFYVAKALGADDIVDVVVPRANIASFLHQVSKVAAEHSAIVVGCGHAGDGNVHLAVFQPDHEVRHKVMIDIFRTGMTLGGSISGEHGLGTAKYEYFLELEDPAKIGLMNRIKLAFDPSGILGTGVGVGTAGQIEGKEDSR